MRNEFHVLHAQRSNGCADNEAPPFINGVREWKLQIICAE
jgi:hypothetical protein